MKISTEIGSAANIIGEEKAIELYGKAGFDAWDFSMFAMARYDYAAKQLIETNHPLRGNEYLKFARKLKQIGLDNGMVCNQSHAPFPSYAPQVLSYMKRAIECTAEAGGSICIIHPMNYSSVEENKEMYLGLLPFAKEYGVKIATENMFCWYNDIDDARPAACSSPESFCDHIRAVNAPYLVACLDIGHAEMRGVQTSAVEMIHALGDSLQALHVHDNDKRHDSHQIPFSMNIDFDPIIKALKEIGYGGYLTLEADRYLSKFNKDNIFEGMKDLKNAASKLADAFDAL